MRRIISKRFVFTALYLVCLFLFLEGVSRLALFCLSKSWEPVVPPQIGRFDPDLGWSLEPGACATSKRTGRKVTYCINTKGVRGAETAYQKTSKGTFRIVLLGDSRVFGFGVDIEDHFSTLLEGYYQNVQVINLGVDGYGIDQCLLRLRKEGFKYHPDMVMLYVPHYQDERHMHTSRWGMGKPMFELQDGALKLVNTPVANNNGWYITLRKIDKHLAVYSKFYQILRDFAIHLADTEDPMSLAALKLLSEDVHAAQKTSDAGVAQERKRKVEFYEKVNEVAEKLVFTIRDEAADHGAQFVLLTAVERLYNVTKTAGLHVHNVTAPLANHAYALPDKLAHFNEAGNGALAWDIAMYLNAHHLIPQSNLSPHAEFNYSEKSFMDYDDR